MNAPSATPRDGDAPAEQDGWRDGSGGAAGTHPSGDLSTLRAELDRIDNAMHALLIERAGVVEHVARSGKPAAFRPGREAAIVRRLLGQHEGKLPDLALCRIWREMFACTTRMQGPFVVGVGGARGGNNLGGDRCRPGGAGAGAFWRADRAAPASRRG